jgi:hypothetical protein
MESEKLYDTGIKVIGFLLIFTILLSFTGIVEIPLLAVTGGTVILSLDKVSINGEDQYVSLFTISSGGDEYTIQPTLNELNNKLLEYDEEASNTYTLYGEISDSKCTYTLTDQIYNTSQAFITDFSGTVQGSFLGKSKSEQFAIANSKCAQSSAVNYASLISSSSKWISGAYYTTMQESGIGDGSFTCYLIRLVNFGTAQVTSGSPQYSSKVTFTLVHPTAGSETQTLSINDPDAVSDSGIFDFGSGKEAYIKNIQAGFATGKNCQGTGTQIAIITKSSDSQSYLFSNFNLQYLNDIKSLYVVTPSNAPTQSELSTLVNNVQTNYNTLLVSTSTKGTKSSQNSFYYDVSASDMVLDPAFVLYTNADFLGIKKIYSEPDVTSISFSSSTKYNGASATLTYTIKNKGKTEGDMLVSYNCPYTTVKGDYTEGKVDAGETVTRTVSGYISTSIDTSAQCTVTATDSNDPTKTDSMTSNSYNVIKSTVCWGSALYSSTDGKCHCTLASSVSKTIISDDYGCEYQDTCAQPTLNSHEIWTGYPVCAKSCEDGYYYDWLGSCVQSQITPTPEETTELTCQEQVDTISCDFWDVSCQLSKVTKSIECLREEINALFGEIILFGITIVMFGVGIYLAFFYKPKRGKK